jgi:hypothetical protein
MKIRHLCAAVAGAILLTSNVARAQENPSAVTEEPVPGQEVTGGEGMMGEDMMEAGQQMMKAGQEMMQERGKRQRMTHRGMGAMMGPQFGMRLIFILMDTDGDGAKSLE